MATDGEINLLQYADFSRKALVVGELQLNINKAGSCSRLAAEAPVPVYYESESAYQVTGAASVARNLKALGIDVDLVACVAKSDEKFIKDYLKSVSVQTDHLIPVEGYVHETTTRFFDNEFQIFQSCKPFRLDNPIAAEKMILKGCTALIETSQYAVAIVLYCDDGCMSDSLLQAIIHLSNCNHVPSFVRTRKSRLDGFKGADYMLVKSVTNTNFSVSKELKVNDELEKYKSLSNKLEIKKALFMLSEMGISYLDIGEAIHHFYPFSTTRIGRNSSQCSVQDAIVASIGFGVSCCLSNQQSLNLAAACVGYLLRDNSRDLVSLIDVLPSKVIRNIAELENFVNFIPKDKQVVLTTGCFDLLHAGHVKSLKQASEYGDILIVLLNLDRSVKELKGPERPIYCQQERLELLLAVKYVDFVVLFDETRPYKQVKMINPDVFVKGDEYTEETIMEHYPFLKQYKSVSMVTGLSTTNNLGKIRNKNQ